MLRGLVNFGGTDVIVRLIDASNRNIKNTSVQQYCMDSTCIAVQFAKELILKSIVVHNFNGIAPIDPAIRERRISHVGLPLSRYI